MNIAEAIQSADWSKIELLTHTPSDETITWLLKNLPEFSNASAALIVRALSMLGDGKVRFGDAPTFYYQGPRQAEVVSAVKAALGNQELEIRKAAVWGIGSFQRFVTRTMNLVIKQ